MKTLVASLLLTAFASAGPIDFGQAELRRAVAERGVTPQRLPVLTEYSMVLPHDGFSILGNIVRGGSQRGLMYGLLEAAEQVRQRGFLTAVKREPSNELRGVRWVVRAADQDEAWFQNSELWRGFFQTLARERINRFNLVFREPLSLMLSGWVRPPGRSGSALASGVEELRERRLAGVRAIAQMASDYGVEFVLGFWPSEGTGDASYVRDALPMLVAACPALHGIQLSGESNGEAAIDVLGQAGRLVQLDLRTAHLDAKLLASAVASKIPLRLAAPFNSERFGPPYPPLQAAPGESFDNYLEKPPVPDRPRAWRLYWELWGASAADAAYVRRAVASFAIGGGAGFEIDAPHAGPEWQADGALFHLWGRAGYWRDELKAPVPVTPRIAIEHTPPKIVWAGKPLTLALRVWPQTGITWLRLHYRALNQQAEWKMIETPVARPVFTIPAADVDPRWDLQYWFELTPSLAWPDASTATPYYVVSVLVETPRPPPPPEPGA